MTDSLLAQVRQEAPPPLCREVANTNQLLHGRVFTPLPLLVTLSQAPVPHVGWYRDWGHLAHLRKKEVQPKKQKVSHLPGEAQGRLIEVMGVKLGILKSVRLS